MLHAELTEHGQKPKAKNMASPKSKNESKEADPAFHKWLSPIYIGGFTTAAAFCGALLWSLLSAGWLNTPAKEIELTEVKRGVDRLDERLKGFSGIVERRLDGLVGDVRQHGEAVAEIRAMQARTNAGLDALTAAMLRRVPAAAPIPEDYRPEARRRAERAER
jgi:hypothetical protein